MHVLAAARTFFHDVDLFSFDVGFTTVMFSYVQLCAVMCPYVRLCAGGAPVRLFNVNYPATEGLRPYGPKTAATINNFN